MTQGDPLVIPMYAFTITPLIKELKDTVRIREGKQVCYVDDASGTGDIYSLRQWNQPKWVDGNKKTYYMSWVLNLKNRIVWLEPWKSTWPSSSAWVHPDIECIYYLIVTSAINPYCTHSHTINSAYYSGASIITYTLGAWSFHSTCRTL